MDIVELKEKLSEIKQMEYIETLKKGQHWYRSIHSKRYLE